MEYEISVLNKEIEDLKTAAAEPHIGIIEQSSISDAIGSCQVAVSDLTYLCEGEKPQQSESNCAIPVVINWVAVKDELPNKGDEVLTITEDGWYRVMTFGSTGRRFPAQVTHWQILPKPPCL